MRRSTAARFIFLFLAITSHSLSSGPTYSRFGLGEILFFGGSRIDAMGGAGIGLLGDRFINRYNPAGLARLSFTRISAGFEYSRVSSEDFSGSSNYARGDFAGLAFAVPISKDDGIVWSLESAPYSRVNYAVERADSQLGVQSRQFYVGSGGLSTASTALSWTMFSNLTIGAKFGYLYGRIRQTANFDFTDPTFIDSEISRSTYYSGFLFTGGIIYEGLSDALDVPSLKTLAIGAILTPPTTLYANDEDVLTTTDSFDTTRTASSRLDVPLRLGAGFSYMFSDRYILTGDYVSQQWASTNLPRPRGTEFRNSTRLAIGFEVLPERDIDTYTRRMAYRFGFSYYSTYLRMNGEPINEYYLTGGVGLPIAVEARMNVGLHVGFRGTTSQNLQKDTVFRLTLSLSAGEPWFIRFEEE
ncbi:MAG: hypothetical protein HY562_06925 [Ignavibacteriales bacterium]|nr:hypothetical protein [Ignavibacteriales bacterium]